MLTISRIVTNRVATLSSSTLFFQNAQQHYTTQGLKGQTTVTKDSMLPDYVVINDDNTDKALKANLEKPSAPYNFPLSTNDKKELTILEKKYDSEQKIAGLAAPQIGIHKQAIIFAAPDDPILRKYRSDLTDTMDKSLWLNPSYEAVDDEITIDYEACCSVKGLAGSVPRHTRIRYTKYDIDGNKKIDIVSGYLARVIQHEIDHINGILFINKVPEGKMISIDEYRKLQQEKLKSK